MPSASKSESSSSSADQPSDTPTVDEPVATAETGFRDLGLSATVLAALDTIGYETPSPIQAAVIPHVLAGRDVIGQAQTGTGKTAAFALPLLSNLDLNRRDVQILVLAPTRELAIQVAEAFQTYAQGMSGFHVLPIYGGSPYSGQLRQLQRGVHIVVGTPGRVMDHIRRGTLKLDTLDCLVLDEADEMLRMGFIDDVEWILDQTPPTRQVALFSATMPPAIRRIAQKYLNEPEEIAIKVRTTTAETIRQRYWMVSGVHKLDALTRILEAETFDGIIIFVRTKRATEELASKLEARGFACAPLSGDVAQNQRERTVDALKSGKLDIIVATDVAARGLDVDRISHVINYDIPNDTEAYVHRIGRTGRAGRTGDAILFVAPRERRMLRAIEQATRQKIELMELPTTDTINSARVTRFLDKVTDTLATEELGEFYNVLEAYRQEHNVPALELASALAKMLHGDEPLLLPDRPVRGNTRSDGAAGWEPDRGPSRREREQMRDNNPRDDRRNDRFGGDRFGSDRGAPGVEPGMDRYRIEVGHTHGAQPGHIVGAIANESGLDGRRIGRIQIEDDHSIVDLPEGMPDDIMLILRKAWVAGRPLSIRKLDGNLNPIGDVPVAKDGRPPRETGHRKGPKADKGGSSAPTFKSKKKKFGPGTFEKKKKAKKK